MINYVKSTRVRIRDRGLNEAWVEDRIEEDPAQLGLGSLEVLKRQRIQVRAGRLDMLLQAEDETLFELELQLDATDESHIIRTIEYWDNERRRYPDAKHVAVIVAEDITSRFLNVVRLFNGFIPIIAVQMSAVEVGPSLTLVFTKVVDWAPITPEDLDEPEMPADRAYWIKRASETTMGWSDQLTDLVTQVDPRMERAMGIEPT